MHTRPFCVFYENKDIAKLVSAGHRSSCCHRIRVCFFFLNAHERNADAPTGDTDAISAFLFFHRAHVLESLSLSLSKSSSPNVHTSARSWIRDEYGVLCHSASIPSVRSDLWNTADGSVLLTRCSLSLSLSLSLLPLRPSPSFSAALSLPLPLQFNPHLCMCVEVEELQHPPAGTSRAWQYNRHGPNVRSSPPANRVNPINALGRPQTKKSPPGTLALSRVRYVFVLKCPVLFWSSSPVISAAI